jgi:hypothetical protein
MKGGCTPRPRCVASVPNMKQLHDEARAHNMVVWYSLVGLNGKATPDDIMDPAIKPRAGEWVRADRSIRNLKAIIYLIAGKLELALPT